MSFCYFPSNISISSYVTVLKGLVEFWVIKLMLYFCNLMFPDIFCVSFIPLFFFSYELLAITLMLYPKVDLQRNEKDDIPLLAKAISMEKEEHGFPYHQILVHAFELHAHHVIINLTLNLPSSDMPQVHETLYHGDHCTLANKMQ